MISLGDVWSTEEDKRNIEVRDPWREPYGDPSRNTKSQEIIYDLYKNGPSWRTLGPVLATIGAKGCAKTHTGACMAWIFAQKYPGSLGCIIANSFPQAKETAGKTMIKVGKKLGYSTEFFQQKKIYGEPITSTYVLTLKPGVYSYVLLRSFANADDLEGIELDWIWCEELQDVEMADFNTAVSRVRGNRGDRTIMAFGMTDDELHWMYRKIPRLIERRPYLVDYEQGEDVKRGNGILLEPPLIENRKNVGQSYIDSLYDIYDKATADRLIHGKRGSLNNNKVAYNYRDFLHRSGNMSQLCCNYSQSDHIFISFDFNVAPMSVTVWRKAIWNDRWDDFVFEDDKWIEVSEPNAAPIEHPHFIYPGDREVGAQIDEFEVWTGGTRKMCQDIISKYQNHQGRITVIGDATGNRDDTRSGTTDWQIITEEFMSQFPHTCTIIPGLIQNMDMNRPTKYSNPPRGDSINILNRVLQNAKGQVDICFLPKSELASGGAASSVFAAKRRPDGTIDESVDKKAGKDVQRLHFFDTVRYWAWYYTGGRVMDTSILTKQIEDSMVFYDVEGDHSGFAI